MHFILRHQNPVTGEWQEKHAKATPTIKVDRKSNLYTLIIRPDNTFEIQINGVSEKKGRCGSSRLETINLSRQRSRT